MNNEELLETGYEITLLINQLKKNVTKFYALQENLKIYERTSTKDILNTFSYVSSLDASLPCQVESLRNKLNNVNRINILDEIHYCNQGE